MKSKTIPLFLVAVVVLIAITLAVQNPSIESTPQIAVPAVEGTAETPAADWRAQLLRGFELAQNRDWLAAEDALAEARRNAPENEEAAGNGLQVYLHSRVGRIRESLDLVKQQAQIQPDSRDASRVLQQWLDRAGDHAAAEAEYARSSGLPGDTAAMEMTALVRALGTGDAALIEERFDRFRETEWATAGDNALYIVRSDRDAALHVLREQIDEYEDPNTMSPRLAAAWAAYYGDAELAVTGLRVTSRLPFQTEGMLWDPVFADVRNSPEFKTMLRDFGYLEYWRATGEWGDFCRPLGADDFECR
jgi:hypothetical protein